MIDIFHRQQSDIQDSIEQNSHRMDRLEQDADTMEREVKELKEKRQTLTKDAQSFKEQVKGQPNLFSSK